MTAAVESCGDDHHLSRLAAGQTLRLLRKNESWSTWQTEMGLVGLMVASDPPSFRVFRCCAATVSM